MRLTTRDSRVINDMALSHALARDQLVNLGYFRSITRVNTRLRELAKAGFVKRLDTPFFAQGLYAVGHRAHELLSARISPIVAARIGSPRFLQHALCTTNVRIHLLNDGARSWRFEQQLRCSFRYGGREFEVRPDGLAVYENRLAAVEVDLGHVSLSKFKDKVLAYEAFVSSGECNRQWKAPTFELLTVTTGDLRASRLGRQIPLNPSFSFTCTTANELGIPFVGAWS